MTTWPTPHTSAYRGAISKFAALFGRKRSGWSAMIRSTDHFYRCQRSGISNFEPFKVWMLQTRRLTGRSPRSMRWWSDRRSARSPGRRTEWRSARIVRSCAFVAIWMQCRRRWDGWSARRWTTRWTAGTRSLVRGGEVGNGEEKETIRWKFRNLSWKLECQFVKSMEYPGKSEHSEESN